MDFKDNVALVTGSGRGIGRAIALRLAELGADVGINFFRNREPAEETAEVIRSKGRRSETFRANVGELDEVNALVDGVVDTFGGLDILVCNAAMGYNRPIMEQRPKGWQWSMNVNARSALFAAKRAAPTMKSRGGGSIVNISSPGAVRVIPDYSVVGASKAALEALTRYLAVELAPMGISANAVSPGVVDTEALQHFAATSDPELLDRAADRTPAGRLVTPEDVANLVAFLCSPKAAMIRGQVIVMDGGYTLPLEGVHWDPDERRARGSQSDPSS
ncbi:MAG: enoyl-[acyl-carrier-protein] reductase FabL [Anaerolineales bacterium]|nr:enoyl-[acyl-carrier-protein] reductase FabL [Anaerolineales bacterium]